MSFSFSYPGVHGAHTDHGMLGFLKYQNETAKYYTDLMSKLERMNGTLGTVLHYLDNMQSRIEERLHVIQGYLGWAGETRDTRVSEKENGCCIFYCVHRIYLSL